MNFLKSDLKRAIIQDLGLKFDDMKEHREKQVQQFVGAKTVLAQTAKDIQTLHGAADRDLEEGKIKDLEQLELAKLYVTRAMNSVELKRVQVSNLELIERGKLEQASQTVEMMEKMYLKEQARMENILRQVKDGTLLVEDDGSLAQVIPEGESNGRKPRAAGARPAQSIAQQRKAKAKPKAKAATKKPARSRKKPQSKAKSNGEDTRSQTRDAV